MTGLTISHYRIISKLGSGGMGEVYRARDTKLSRDVAIKILPETFSREEERVARFKREAQALASLNHPNIAAIYGLEESSGELALVMELVEGFTLADRIEACPIPLDEALPIARQATSRRMRLSSYAAVTSEGTGLDKLCVILKLYSEVNK